MKVLYYLDVMYSCVQSQNLCNALKYLCTLIWSPNDVPGILHKRTAVILRFNEPIYFPIHYQFEHRILLLNVLPSIETYLSKSRLHSIHYEPYCPFKFCPLFPQATTINTQKLIY